MGTRLEHNHFNYGFPSLKFFFMETTPYLVVDITKLRF